MKLFCWVIFFHLLLFAFFPHRPPTLPPKKKLSLSFQTFPEKMNTQTKQLIACSPPLPSIPPLQEKAPSKDLVPEPTLEPIALPSPPSPPEKIPVTKEVAAKPAPKTKKDSSPSKSTPKETPKSQKKEPSPLEKLTTITNPPTPSKPKEKKKQLAQGEKKTAPKTSSPIVDQKQSARNKEIAKIRSQLNEAKKGLDLPYSKNQKALQLSSDTVEEESFLTILVLFLQEHLHMPYPDEIAVSLILSTQGKCLGVTISHCKNQENRSYLEKRLPELSYPNFPHKKKQQSFSLLFEVD